MKYSVYVHRRADTNIVFYVGVAASLRRANSKSLNKTRKWKIIDQEAGGHTVEIIHSSLSRAEAVDLENKYLSDPPADWLLVNVNGPRVNLDYSSVNWKEIFDYDETVLGCLKWKASGQIAGNFNSKGRHRVRYKNQYYLGYRIVYSMFNPNFNKQNLINHIDCDLSNSKIENLEEVDYQDNIDKSKMFLTGLSDNETGLTNITKCSRRNGCAFIVRYKLDGKIKHKQFNVNKLGEDAALKLAVEFRNENDSRFIK